MSSAFSQVCPDVSQVVEEWLRACVRAMSSAAELLAAAQHTPVEDEAHCSSLDHVRNASSGGHCHLKLSHGSAFGHIDWRSCA